MARRNVDTKQSSSAGRGARVVGADEFKHELLKFARRDAKEDRGLALLSVVLRNASTLRNLCGEDALDRLGRALRSTVGNVVYAQHLITPLGPDRVLVMYLGTKDAATALADELRGRVDKITVPGFGLKPSFDVSVAADVTDPYAALAQLDCEIDEHGDLREIQRRLDLSSIGSYEHWLSRYDVSSARVIDRWRRVPVHLTESTVALNDGVEAIVRRARELQSLDHPALEPLRDFWVEKTKLICVTDPARGKKLTEWLASHELNAAAMAELLGQWVSALIYGKAMTPPLVPLGMHAQLMIVPADLRLHLSDFHTDLILSDHIATDGELVEDARKFAALLGGELPRELNAALNENTIHKIRAAVKDAGDKSGAPRVVPKEPPPHA